jgi:hypothetical protein
MTAAIAMGEAMGITPRAVVELLPPIEAAMLRHIANLDEHSETHQS